MERNANFDRLIFFILLVSLNNSVQAQEYSLSKQEVRYSQINVEFSAHENKFLTDTAKFNYDLGLGLAVEKEIYFNQKLAALYNGGAQLYHSRSSSENFSARVFAIQAKVGGKYYLWEKTALYGGILGYYGFLVQHRDGTMDGWDAIENAAHFNGGLFIGLDVTLKSWSSLRFLYAITPRLHSFQLSLTITPSIISNSY